MYRFEFEVGLVYTASARLAELHRETLSKERKQERIIRIIS